MPMIRLQGSQFAAKKDSITLVAYSVSDRGNICGYYKYSNSDFPNFYHWMNDKEKVEFLNQPATAVQVPNHRSAYKRRFNNEEEIAI